MARLERSLARAAHRARRCRRPRSRVVMRETIRRNRVRDGIVYLQVTRGVARRDFPFPPPGTRPSAGGDRAQQRSRSARADWRPKASRSSPCPTSAGSASTSSRWRCCPTCWPSRPRASRARARPGWSTRTGRVTEGASSNAWIVSPRRQADHASARPRYPARHHRSVVIEVHQGARARVRGARLHGRGGLCGARSLHHLGEPDRAAGGHASTAGRSATARPA